MPNTNYQLHFYDTFSHNWELEGQYLPVQRSFSVHFLNLTTEVLQSTKYLETFRENRFRKEVEMRRDRQKVKCWRKFGLTVQ